MKRAITEKEFLQTKIIVPAPPMPKYNGFQTGHGVWADKKHPSAKKRRAEGKNFIRNYN